MATVCLWSCLNPISYLPCVAIKLYRQILATERQASPPIPSPNPNPNPNPSDRHTSPQPRQTQDNVKLENKEPFHHIFRSIP